MDQKDIINGSIADHEVIRRILQGEKQLYELIIRRYNQRLYRAGMSIINDDAGVEELMQIAYIKAYEHIGKFEFKSSFSTWITRILINECLMSLKRRKKVNEANDSMYHASYHHYSMDKQTPLIKVLNSELKEILERSIQSLPEKYRIVFVMREIENMNIAETKECLGISETNVKVRLNRAKSLLRDSLSSYVKKEDLLHFHLSRCDNMVQKVMDRIRAI